MKISVLIEIGDFGIKSGPIGVRPNFLSGGIRPCIKRPVRYYLLFANTLLKTKNKKKTDYYNLFT